MDGYFQWILRDKVGNINNSILCTRELVLLKSTTTYMGIGIFIGWVIAILVNYNIYEHTTSQATFFHPILDAILFMAMMLLLFFIITQLYNNKESFASIVLTVLGIISIALAFIYV